VADLQKLGIDLDALRLVMVLNLMIGLLHPPLGTVLFVLRAPQAVVERTQRRYCVARATVRGALVCTYVPEIVLWLPKPLRRDEPGGREPVQVVPRPDGDELPLPHSVFHRAGLRRKRKFARRVLASGTAWSWSRRQLSAYLFFTDAGKLQASSSTSGRCVRENGRPVSVEGMEWIKAQESVRNGSRDVIDALVYKRVAARKPTNFPRLNADVDARVFFNRSITGSTTRKMRASPSAPRRAAPAASGWRRGASNPALVPDVRCRGRSRAHQRSPSVLHGPAWRSTSSSSGATDEFRQTGAAVRRALSLGGRHGWRTDLRDFHPAGIRAGQP